MEASYNTFSTPNCWNSASQIGEIDISNKLEEYVQNRESKNFTKESDFEEAHKYTLLKFSKNPSEMELFFLCVYRFDCEADQELGLFYLKSLPLDVIKIIIRYMTPELEIKAFKASLMSFREKNLFHIELAEQIKVQGQLNKKIEEKMQKYAEDKVKSQKDVSYDENSWCKLF